MSLSHCVRGQTKCYSQNDSGTCSSRDFCLKEITYLTLNIAKKVWSTLHAVYPIDFIYTLLSNTNIGTDANVLVCYSLKDLIINYCPYITIYAFCVYTFKRDYV